MKRIESGSGSGSGVKRRSTVKRLSMRQLREWGWERVPSSAGGELLAATMLSGGVIVRCGGQDLAVTEVRQLEGGQWELWGWDMRGESLRGRRVSAAKVYIRWTWG